MKIALDTNILVYAEGVNDAARQAAALEAVHALPRASTVIPLQVLGELFHVLVRKGRSPREARRALQEWHDTYSVIETSDAVMLSAADLAADHQLSIWDAVILSASSQAGCRLLLSEDMHADFSWGGVTVVNPLAEPRPALLEAALAADRD